MFSFSLHTEDCTGRPSSASVKGPLWVEGPPGEPTWGHSPSTVPAVPFLASWFSVPVYLLSLGSQRNLSSLLK